MRLAALGLVDSLGGEPDRVRTCSGSDSDVVKMCTLEQPWELIVSWFVLDGA